MSLTVNGLDVASLRFLEPWSGVWCAELEMHHGIEVLPSGRVVIVSTDGIALVGTVDPKFSGSFGEQKHLRVVGGGGGWGKKVRKKPYHSDVGVPLAMLATTTAAEAGEVVTVLTPKFVGKDFIRRDGPAAQIFADAGVDWWVGRDGITRVGIRLPAVPPPSLEVLNWDPATSTMTFNASVIPEPGTIIVDTRFGKRIVREVEAHVSKGAVTGTLVVAEATPDAGHVSELAEGIGDIAKHATRIAFARVYEYRVIAMAGDRVELQAVKPTDGVPDILPASVWSGISGYRAVLRPASSVLVGFIAGDPRYPYVAAYEPPEGEGWRPLKLELDALTFIEMGGPLATGVATQASMTPLFFAIGLFLTAIQAFLNFPLIAALSGGTAQPAAAAAATVIAQLAAFPTHFSQRVKASV